jgi:hypothetical protein
MKNLFIPFLFCMTFLFSCGDPKEVADIEIKYEFTATNPNKYIDVTYVNSTGGNDEANDNRTTYWSKTYTVKSDAVKQFYKMTVYMYSYSSTSNTDQTVRANIIADGKVVATKEVSGSAFNSFSITAELPTAIKYK